MVALNSTKAEILSSLLSKTSLHNYRPQFLFIYLFFELLSGQLNIIFLYPIFEFQIQAFHVTHLHSDTSAPFCQLNQHLVQFLNMWTDNLKQNYL